MRIDFERKGTRDRMKKILMLAMDQGITIREKRR